MAAGFPPDAPDAPASLYVHIPFCARLCPYCHFHVQVVRDVRDQIPTVDAIVREWNLYAERGWWDPPLATAYLGGGTPSALRDEALARAVDWLRDDVGPRLSAGAEVTLETNPEDATPQTLGRWVAAGVNRLSLGVQAGDADTLRFLGRAHDPDTTQRALDVAADLVRNVSLDLIVGTPGVDTAATLAWLDSVVDDRVQHASLYLLEIHEGTAFHRQVARGRWRPAPGEAQGETYLAAAAWLESRGFTAYELSNHARPGHASVHNGRYWRREPYVGLGPSAHSFAGRNRWWNPRDGAAYLAALEAGRFPVEGGEELDDAAVRDERVLLGLRRREGIPREWLPESGSRVEALVEAGLAHPDPDRLALTPAGWLLHDEICAQLLR